MTIAVVVAAVVAGVVLAEERVQRAADAPGQSHPARAAGAAVQEPAVLAELAQQTRQLANDFEGAELERWGMLSSLNGELARRLGDLHLLIGGLIGGLVVVLLLLGRALLITRRTQKELRQAKGEIEATRQTTLELELKLPLAAAAGYDVPAPLATVAAAAAETPATRERFDGRILLVDDSPLVLEASRGMLESFGLEVIAVDSGQQALEHCGRDDIDLVLLDCRMPGMDGFATAQAWRQKEGGLRRTAIIAVSAELDAADSERLRRSQIDDFLPKPYNVPKLAALLRQWLAPAR